jgi:hypothetical protein
MLAKARFAGISIVSHRPFGVDATLVGADPDTSGTDRQSQKQRDEPHA